MNNKILLTGLVLVSLTGTTFAAGINNTVNSTAAYYGAEAYGNSNKIEETGRSAFVAGYNNTVSANNALVYGVKNKAEGINSLVGGEYSKATGRNSVAIGSSAQALKDNTFAIGSQARTNGDNTVAIGNGAYASNTNALAMGYSTEAKGKDSVAVGSYIQSKTENNVAIGNNITTNDKNSVGIGSTVTTKSNNSVGIGSMVITNKDKSIAIGNGVATDFNTIGIGNGVETKVQDTIAIGNGVVSNGESSVAIGNGIHANGVKSVNIGTNVSAKGVSSIVVGRDTEVSGDDTTVVGANNGTVGADQSVVVGYNNKVLDNSKEQLIFGVNSQTKGQGSVVVGSHASATEIDALALGNNTIADVQNSVALGTNSTTEEAVSTDHIYINGEKYDFAGGVANSTVSIGANNKAGNGGVQNYKRTLTNVAAGRVDGTSTDAINGSQLNAVINALKFTTVAEGTNTTVTQSTNIDGGKEFAVHVNKDLVNMNSVQFGTVNDPQRNFISKDGMHVFNGDVNTNYTPNGINIENTNNLDTASYTMNGMQASSNGKDIRFSTDGISAGNQIINSVKTGIADTDAVNVKQLKDYVATNDKDTITTVMAGNNVSVTNDNNHNYKVSVSKDFSDKVDNNTSRINNLDNKINDVGRNALERANHYTDLQVNKGVAKASALAGLKFLDYNPKDKWSFAASVGHYRNANAVAVGAAYQPNENTMVHGGITVDGKVAYNLGVSVKVGGQKYINKYELAEQVRQLQSDNAELRQELAELRSMIESNK